MVTGSPIVPEVGERDLMEGVCTVKVLPTDFPTTFVTCTCAAPAPKPSGTGQVIAVSDQEVTLADIPLNVTDP